MGKKRPRNVFASSPSSDSRSFACQLSQMCATNVTAATLVGTPADRLLSMLGELLDGTLPSIQDVLYIQSSILESVDIYQPTDLGAQLLAVAAVDGMDVSGSGDVYVLCLCLLACWMYGTSWKEGLLGTPNSLKHSSYCNHAEWTKLRVNAHLLKSSRCYAL